MNPANIIDVSRLSRYNFGPQAPLWWGFVGMIVIESTVIATLIASYFYLKMGSVSWPPAGTEMPKLMLPTINTVVLLASSVAMHRADKSIDRGKQRGLITGLLAGIVLATVFLGIKAYEYGQLEYDWSTHSYGSIVWGISMFHAAHVLSVVLKTVFVAYLAIRGYFNQQRRLGVTVNGLYWHFVVAIWVPLYVVLYWSPRFL
jgi:heme/copper-type cytochrome/quinol oxidase subunit 3